MSSLPEPVSVVGLKDRQRELKRIGDGGHKALRLVFNAAADRIVADARVRVPTVTGRARRSIRARSTQTRARVIGGGNKAPYFPWLDFGGRRNPPSRAVERIVIREGRYIYLAFYENEPEVIADLNEGLRDLVVGAGLEM